jgi:hypothetical protein
MSTTQTFRREATSYTPTPSRQAQLEEGLNCILSGRGFPAHLAPAAHVAHCPATCTEGLTRILSGPSAEPTLS